MTGSATTRCYAAVLGLLIEAALPVTAATAGADSANPPRSWRELMWERPVAIRDGVTLRAYELEEPRPMKVFVARIDLAAPGVGFTATERAEGWGERMTAVTNEVCLVETRLETTADFMARRRADGFDVEVAVNTTYWLPFPVPDGNFTADPVGWCVADGVEVSRPRECETAFIVRRDGSAEIVSSVPVGTALADVAFAASGSALILDGGAEVPNDHPVAREPHPRTAVGLTADRRTLVLMVVDGRQPGWSEGADFADMARLLRAEGCSDALNMDGGGSSSLVVFDHASGEPVMLNSHANGAVRATAVNLGITFGAASDEPPRRPRHAR